ncbi:MAG: outer membrane lipid asymmetry maintenance protein MlaD [Candidatus Binatia bacterium]|nr:MAG: outer membrane lipid asymmetry maintenance protein MlaD [Candidatus Binatia bacterium]
MPNTSRRDLVVGLFVLAGLAALAFLSIRVGGLSYKGPGGFRLYARFDEIGGLKPRAPVVIAGVKVGQVENISLGDDYRAVVEMDLDPGLRLPVDTSASILTAGILGDRYISLQIGGEEEYLRDGEEISFTESAVLLERLLGRFIHRANLQNGSTE